jgi:hypothetical protein
MKCPSHFENTPQLGCLSEPRHVRVFDEGHFQIPDHESKVQLAGRGPKSSESPIFSGSTQILGLPELPRRSARSEKIFARHPHEAQKCVGGPKSLVFPRLSGRHGNYRRAGAPSTIYPIAGRGHDFPLVGRFALAALTFLVFHFWGASPSFFQKSRRSQ